MAQLHLRVKLNEGRVGIPLRKFVAITDEIQKFLKMVCQDVDLMAESDAWLAQHFQNGSVEFAVKNTEFIPDTACHAFHSLTERIMKFHRGVADDYSDIRRATLGQYAKIAKPLDIDEKVSLGLMQPEEPEQKVEWHNLTKQTSADIEEYLERPSTVEYYGGIQGIIYALAKETEKPHITIRVLSTRELVKCYYKEDLYDRIIELLKEKDAVIYVAGMIRANLATREIEQVVADKFKVSESFSDQDLDRFLGCAPRLTGELSTNDFIAKIRKDAH